MIILSICICIIIILLVLCASLIGYIFGVNKKTKVTEAKAREKPKTILNDDEKQKIKMEALNFKRDVEILNNFNGELKS